MQQKNGIEITFECHFEQRKKQKKLVKGKRLRSKQKPEKLPGITKLVASACHYQKLIDDGLIKDYTELAVQTNVSKARISQIINLLFLAPEIQTTLINADMDKLITERQMRKIAGMVLWTEQVEFFSRLLR